MFIFRFDKDQERSVNVYSTLSSSPTFFPSCLVINQHVTSRPLTVGGRSERNTALALFKF